MLFKLSVNRLVMWLLDKNDNANRAYGSVCKPTKKNVGSVKDIEPADSFRSVSHNLRSL